MLYLQLQNLSPEDRKILQSGSVAGERFSIWAASSMLDEPPASIQNRCDWLDDRNGFIRSAGVHDAPNGSPSANYEFRHSLYRQAFYRSLPGLNRSELHLRLGQRLMAICTAGKPGLAPEVASHFEAGRDYDRAALFLMQSAENAQKRFSTRDSLQVLRQALDLISGPGTPAR